MGKKVRFCDNPSISYFKIDDPPNILSTNSLFSIVTNFLRENRNFLVFIICFLLLFINL